MTVVVFLFEGMRCLHHPLLFWCPRGFAGSYVVVHPSFSSSFSSKSSVLVWWCTRLVVLWSPSSSFPPISFSGRPRQRWIGRWVSATPTSTMMSSPTPPRPLWTKSSFASSSSKKSNRKRSVFLGSSEEQINGSFALYASHSKRKEDDTQKARFYSSKRGKIEEGKNAKRVSIYYLVRRARIRAHLRVALVPGVVHPDGSTARDRVVLVFSSSSSSFRRRRLLLLERSTTWEWCEYY